MEKRYFGVQGAHFSHLKFVLKATNIRGSTIFSHKQATWDFQKPMNKLSSHYLGKEQNATSVVYSHTTTLGKNIREKQ